MLQGGSAWKLGLSLVLFWVVFGAGSAGAATIHVDDDAPNDPGPGDPTVSDPGENGWSTHPFDTIQEGIDAADAGDTVLVQDGLYTGAGNKELDFDGKDIILRSVNGPKTCTIDCENDGFGFNFHSGESPSAVLSGFTITRAYGWAGGIYCGQSSPTIRDCILRGNVTYDHGGGIRLSSSNSWVINCLFRDNRTTYYHGHGGGLSTYMSSPLLLNCAFVNNAATGDSGAGGGVFLGDSVTVVNCTFYGNTAKGGNAGGVHCDYGADPTITNCILWDNYPLEVSTSGDPVITYSDVRGGIEGEGNLALDPGFALAGDVHLAADSPCIDAGTDAGSVPGYDLDDNPRPLDGDGVGGAQRDMGAFEFNPEAASLAVSPVRFAFAAPGGEGDPASQTLELRNCGGGVLNWSVVEDCAWLTVVPTSGTSAGEIDTAQLVVEVAGLDPGDHYCTLSIEDAAAVNSPLSVEVKLHVCATLHVPGEYAAIQDAIDAAVDCDTIVVSDGVYTGARNKDLDFGGRLITLRSANGPENCVIDCEYSGRGFKFQSGETAEAVVDGFTIIRGWSEGAGFHCSAGSSPTITRCIMRDNTPYEGGGIKCYDYCAPAISYCTFRANVVDGSGGGILLSDHCDATISHCTFTHNLVTGYYGRGGGIHCRGSSSPSIDNCVISYNSSVETGGGITLEYNCNALITNCTLRGNYVTGETAAAPMGGGIYVGIAGAQITNCVVWGNAPEQIYDTNDEAEVTFCAVEGGFPGEGNLDEDPVFALEGDAHITSDSPCVDAGNNSPAGGLAEHDLDGRARVLDGDGDSVAVVDIGAYEVDPAAPGLAVAPETLVFFAPVGGDNPYPQALMIRNTGGGTLDWEAATGAAWLTVWPASGSSAGEQNTAAVFVNIAGLDVGRYESSVTISADGIPSSPASIPVVLHVYEMLEVPGEYTTIQAAIDAAQDYDVVLVADGVYTGEGNRQLTCRGKAITVRSAGGPEHCIIDCAREGNGFYFTYGEGRATVIDGFTITRGSAYSGGAVYMDHNGGPTIRNCVMRYNRARDSGGAIYSSSSRGVIINCVITDNVVTDDTGYGGGVYGYGIGGLVVSNCTIVGNECEGGSSYGGGVYLAGSNARLTNCIVWGNGPSNLQIYNSDPVITYCDVQGGFAGEGNLEVDPGFAFEQDYHLLPGSPCVDAGTSATKIGLPGGDIERVTRELDGDGDGHAQVDLGAYEFAPGVPRLARSAPLVEILASEGGPDPVAEVLYVRNCGGGVLEWEVAYECEWLTIEPSSGGSAGESDAVALNAEVGELAGGVYTCSLTVDSSNASNGPFEVEVRLYVRATLHVPMEYGTIQAALDAAADLDYIVVADGTYTGEGNRDLDFKHKEVTLRSANGPEDCIIDCEQQDRAFLFSSGEGRGSVVEGLTIRNGLESLGGAVYCYSASKPTFSECVFEFNQAGRGGAVACTGDSHVALRDCVFRGNGADWEGGALYCSDSKPVVTDCLFIGNSAAEKGGAVWNYSQARPRFRRCAFYDNYTAGDGGAMHNTYYADPRMVDCVLSGNEAAGWGGGIFNDGSDPKIFNSVICGNRAEFGGGVGNLFGDADFTNCLIAGNVSAQEGGAVYEEESAPLLVNCTVAENAAGSGAGALASLDTHGAELVNCIVWSNGIQPIADETDIVYSNVEFGWEGEGNIEAAPGFNETLSGTWSGGGVYDEATGLTTFSDDGSTWVDGELVGRFVRPSATVGVLLLVAQSTNSSIRVMGDHAALGTAGGSYEVLSFELEPGSPVFDAGDNTSVSTDAGDVDGNGNTSERVPLDLTGRARFADEPAVEDSGVADPPDYPVIVDMGAYEGVGQRFVFALDEVDVAEGGRAELFISLARDPLGEVEVSASWFEGDGDISVSPSMLIFDSENHATAQAVELSAAEDDDYLNSEAIVAVVGSNGLVGRVTVVETDNDVVPSVLYVDMDAPGTGDGTSWGGAFQDLQVALGLARFAPGVEEIRVAEGMYWPTGPGGSRTISFALVEGLGIFGGYAGYGEGSPDLRDPASYETVLSGDLNGDDGPEFVNNDENSYHVVTVRECDLTAVLDGFTVRGGNADGAGADGCALGGGISCAEGGALIVGCAFEKNRAAGAGGGAACSAGSVEFENCRFVGNWAASGGGAYTGNDSALEFVACLFDGNTAGGAAGQGGGLLSADGSAVLSGCTFEDNTAGEGGGLGVAGEGIVELERCVFFENTAERGGGLGYLEGVEALLVEACAFYGNVGTESGGAVHVTGGYVGVANSILSGNQAGALGGAVAALGGSSGGLVMELANCSFSFNSAPVGASMACNSAVQGYPGEVWLTNCILWDTVGGIANLDDSEITINYSDVRGGWPGVGNLDADPLYVDPSGADGSAGTVDDDLHPAVESAVVNQGDSCVAGLSEHDFDGNPRVQHCRVDIGAYESELPPAELIDCNDNEQHDDCDVFDGVSRDVNDNRVPDECETGLATAWFVDDDAEAGGDGSSWESAFRHLQDALAVATAGSEVHVAGGVYRPDRSADYPMGTGDRAASFELIDGVALLGGYGGTDALCPDRRDPGQYESILSGDLAGDDESGFVGCAENSYHVVCGTDVGESCVVDGFVVRGGNADGESAELQSIGGGMFLQGASPIVSDLTFTENQAYVGGGLCDAYESSPRVLDCTFEGNAASAGAGMCCFESRAEVRRCLFAANTAESSGGGVYLTSESKPRFRECRFEDNAALGGGAFSSYSSDPEFVDCIFERNAALYAGGGSVSGGLWTRFIDCRFRQNSGTVQVGALYFAGEGTRSVMGNCMFSGNTAGNWAGALRVSGEGVEVSVANCSFSANAAGTRAGGIQVTSGARADIVNTVLWGNTANGASEEWEQLAVEGASATVNYCCLQGWTGDLGGAGNTGADPMWEDALGPDGVAGTRDDDLRLASGSPCIDAGDSAALPADGADTDEDCDVYEPVPRDVAGHARFADDLLTVDGGIGGPPVVDMGAYEYADCNGDGMPDHSEIALGLVPDCNENGVPDACDISLGISGDANGDDIPNECQGLIALVRSYPPHGAIDARKPSDPDGSNPVGWDYVELVFNGDPANVTPADFAVTELGGDGSAPSVTAVEHLCGDLVGVELSGPLEPVTWTTITHSASGSSTRLGYLPADAGGDGDANANDIVEHVDYMNAGQREKVVTPLWQCDIDRSGQLTGNDLIVLIDLLNGVDAYDSYFQVELPE